MTGIAIEYIMCASMCTENCAGMYTPSADDDVNSSSAQPASHQRVLAMGHSPPRLCSLRSQYR